jgi:hypothetical protein
MSVKHVNFYENLREAQMRIRNTVVLYDKEPYYVRAICAHKGTVFRVYLEPLYHPQASKVSPYRHTHPNYPFYQINESYQSEDPALGPALDQWLTANPKSGIIRKKMDSPYFNKFRPFPLGMVNCGEENAGKCYYLERQPMRHREQGLTSSMVMETSITAGQQDLNPITPNGGMHHTSFYTKYFEDMVKGVYPSAKECLDGLLDPAISNEAVAFHRLFALVRGPLDLLFLGYKDQIVGMLPDRNLGTLELGKNFKHLKEIVEEQKVFATVR